MTDKINRVNLVMELYHYISLTSGSYSHITFTLEANLAIGSPSSFSVDTLTFGKDTDVLDFV